MIRPSDLVKPPTVSEPPAGFRRLRARTAVVFGIGGWRLKLGAGLVLVVAVSGLLLIILSSRDPASKHPGVPAPTMPPPSISESPQTVKPDVPAREETSKAPLDLPPRSTPPKKSPPPARTEGTRGSAADKAEADKAKSQMLAEKQRVNLAGQATADYKTAVATEGQGVSLYERSSFKDAAEKFKSATELFKKVASRPAPAVTY
jgi:cytoskeletal protein RodZ